MPLRLFLLAVASAFLLPASVQAGLIIQRPVAVGLSNGLVGHWTFDGPDMAGNRVNDVTGNANHGTRSSSPTTEIGNIGQSLEFTAGSSDVVTIQPSASLNDLAQMSVSFWMYTRSTPDFAPILYKQDSSTTLDGWGIDDCGCGTNDIGFTVGYSGSSILWVVTNTAPIQLNRWQHVAVTWNGSETGGVTFYVDGTVRAQSINNTGTLPRDADSDDTLKLFNDNDGGDAYGASMDDLRIYNRVLSADEIRRLYKIGATLTVNSTRKDTLRDGLVGHWTFDGNDTVHNAGLMLQQDLSGNNNTASSTLGGSGTTPISVLGKLGQAIFFDGANDMLNGGKNASLNNISTITISAWIKPGGADGEIISKNNSGGSSAIGPDLWYEGRNIWFARGWTGGGGTWQTDDNAALTFGVWQHVVLRYDGRSVANVPEFFVNAVRNPNISVAGAPITSLSDDSAQDLAIGSFGSRTSISAHFDGSMDDVRIYNRMLSADEVKRLYKLGATATINSTRKDTLRNGLVGHWTFDGGDMAGSLAMDRSGSNKNGTLTAGIQRVIGHIGQAVDFTLNSDEIVVGTCCSDAGVFSASFWLNTPDNTGGNLMSNGSDSCLESGFPEGWTVGIDGFTGPNGRLCFEVDYDTQELKVTTGTNTILPNTWYHVTLTYDGTTEADNVHFYVNGVEASYVTRQDGSGTKTDDSARDTLIGGTHSVNSAIDGIMDDVRFYNRILTVDEIKRLYSMGR